MKFSDGDMVIVRNEHKASRVIRGTPDIDGDIFVTKITGSGVRAVAVQLCTLAEAASVNSSYPTMSEVSTAESPLICGQRIEQPMQCQSFLSNSNQEKVNTMTNANRTLVSVSLIDQDAGLDAAKSLVKSFGQFILEGSEENLKQEILMSNNVESVLRAHNIVREKETDLDILKRTGNKVMLQPVKIGDLTWVISRA